MKCNNLIKKKRLNSYCTFIYIIFFRTKNINIYKILKKYILQIVSNCGH